MTPQDYLTLGISFFFCCVLSLPSLGLGLRIFKNKSARTSFINQIVAINNIVIGQIASGVNTICKTFWMLGLTLPFSTSICIWILMWKNQLNKEDYLVICSILLQVRVIIFCILMNGYHVSYFFRLVSKLMTGNILCTHLKTCLFTHSYWIPTKQWEHNKNKPSSG